jgi:hypothetical protein
MIPLRDDIPAQRFPVINTWLIIVNVLCFFYEFKLGPQAGRFLMENGFVPARFLALQAENFFDLSRFFPVISSLFLHGGLMHLISNMWMLWIFGDNVEDTLGHVRYLAFYLLCGAVSIFAQSFTAPHSTLPLIGASGAISGVLGAYLLTYPQARILTLVPLFIFFYTIEIPAFFFLIFWFAVQFLQGYVQLVNVGAMAQGGVAWWAHIGGFAAGLLLIFLFRLLKRQPSKVRIRRPKGWN